MNRILWNLVLIGMIIGLQSRVLAETLYEAERAYTRADYETARKLWEEAAIKDNPTALSGLAMLYVNGQGVPRDDVKARLLFERAANFLDSRGQSGLAVMLLNGRGGKQDINLAVDFLYKAARQGRVQAQINLGNLFIRGQHVEKNYSEAAIWYIKAAESGDRYSQAIVGFMYEHGLGVDKNIDAAMKWYRVLMGVNIEVPPSSIEMENQMLLGNFSSISVNIPEIEKSGGYQFIARLKGQSKIIKPSERLTREIASAREANHRLNSLLTSYGYQIILDSYNERHKFTIDQGENRRILENRRRAAEVITKFKQEVLIKDGVSEEIQDFFALIENALQVDRPLKSIASLGERLMEKYDSSHVLHLEGVNLLVSYWLGVKQTSKQASERLEAREKAKSYVDILERIDNIAIMTYFLNPVPYEKAFCSTAYSVATSRRLAEDLYSIERGAEMVSVAKREVSYYKKFISEYFDCLKYNPDVFLGILKNYAAALRISGDLNDYFAISEIIDVINPPSSLGVRGNIRRYFERANGEWLAGRYRESFINQIKGHYLSVAYGEGDYGDSFNSMHLSLRHVANLDWSIAYLLPKLATYEASRKYHGYCKISSNFNQIFSFQGHFEIGILLLKNCIELIYQKAIENSRDSSINSLDNEISFNKNYFIELVKSLELAGRFPEAEQVLDIIKEGEYLDFTRGNSSVNRSSGLGLTSREQRWRVAYGQISSRLGELSRELSVLEQRRKFGLSEVEKAKRDILERDLVIANKAFESFLNEARRELEGRVSGGNIENTESSMVFFNETQTLIKTLGDDVAYLRIAVVVDRISFWLTTSRVYITRSVSISEQQLNLKISQLLRLLRDPKSDPRPLLRELYEVLLRPIEADLLQAQIKTVMLSLDGVLRYVPFGALHDGIDYSLKRWNFPIYSLIARDKFVRQSKGTWDVAGFGVTRRHGSFEALPGVRTEISSIIRNGTSGIFPGVIFLDEDFTGDRLREVSRQRFTAVHIASHFQFSPGTEIDSFLLMGDGSRLTLGDLRTQDYRFDNVDLLTLSACDTGLGGGRDRNGREIEGFGILAQKQGAKAVLATLWKVADRSTPSFMADLYARLATRVYSKIEAIRQAQIALLENPRTRHPFYWAPFILIGNWL